MPSPIEETIADLANCNQPLLNSRLVDLSSLNSAELGLVEQVWAAIEPERRRQIVYQLVELAEDNFELNFDSIFKYCLKGQDADVQMAAMQALGKIGGSEAKKCLEQCLDNPSQVVQQAAVQALDELEAAGDPFSFRI